MHSAGPRRRRIFISDERGEGATRAAIVSRLRRFLDACPHVGSESFATLPVAAAYIGQALRPSRSEQQPELAHRVVVVAAVILTALRVVRRRARDAAHL